MNPINNWNSIEESNGEFKRLEPNGYICQITHVEDVKEKEYLLIEYDIVYGDMKGYAKDTMERAGFNPCRVIRSYKDTAAGFFKNFIRCVEESNPNFKFDWNEQSLVKKYIGFILGEEEYRNKDGDVKVRLSVQKNATINDIKDGNFKIPTLKKLKDDGGQKEQATQTFIPATDDPGLPF